MRRVVHGVKLSLEQLRRRCWKAVQIMSKEHLDDEHGILHCVALNPGRGSSMARRILRFEDTSRYNHLTCRLCM